MSCDNCTRDCPVRDSMFLNKLENALRSLLQGYALPEMIVDKSVRADDYRMVEIAEIYTCFKDGEFDRVDYFWKTGNGYVCDILRSAFNIWKWDKNLERDKFGEFLSWDREYFGKDENKRK